MKQLILILIATLTLFSCHEKVLVAKPAKFIEAEKMTEIITDFYLAKGYNDDAKRGKRIQEANDDKINPSAYIYKKYNIDSLQFSENMNYYLTKKEIITAIFENAEKKLTALKDVYTKEKTTKDSLRQLSKKLSKKELKIEREIHTETKPLKKP